MPYYFFVKYIGHIITYTILLLYIDCLYLSTLQVKTHYGTEIL